MQKDTKRWRIDQYFPYVSVTSTTNINSATINHPIPNTLPPFSKLNSNLPTPDLITSDDSKLEDINLSSQPLSPTEIELLSLGLNFCPNSTSNKFELIKDLYLFARKLTYKFMFDKERCIKQTDIADQEIWKDFTVAEFHALKTLVLLLDKSESTARH